MTTTCPTVTVTAPPPPANITCTQFTTDKTSCVAACTVSVTAKWKNTGGTVGSVQPKVSINGNVTTIPNIGVETFQPGEEKTYTIGLDFSNAAAYTLCPVPN